MKIAINHGDEYNSYRERFMRMYAPRDVKAKQKVVLMLQVSVGPFFLVWSFATTAIQECMRIYRFLYPFAIDNNVIDD